MALSKQQRCGKTKVDLRYSFKFSMHKTQKIGFLIELKQIEKWSKLASLVIYVHLCKSSTDIFLLISCILMFATFTIPSKAFLLSD